MRQEEEILRVEEFSEIVEEGFFNLDDLLAEEKSPLTTEEIVREGVNLGHNLVLEINFNNVTLGEPLDLNSSIWPYLNYLYRDVPTPQYIVLLSETRMWDRFPAEYQSFLRKLHRVFPDATLYYHGRSNNHTQDRSCDLDVAKLTKGAVPPNGLWHMVTHVFQNIPMRKKLLLKVLGVTDDQAEDHFPANVTAYSRASQFLYPILYALWRNYVLRKEVDTIVHMRNWRAQQAEVKELPVELMDSCLSAFFFRIKSSLSARFCGTAKLFPEEAEEEKNAEDLDANSKRVSGLFGSGFSGGYGSKSIKCVTSSEDSSFNYSA